MGSTSDHVARAVRRVAAWCAACAVIAGAACGGTTLDTGGAHPANPAARGEPPVETPPTLRKGFDPDAYLASPSAGASGHEGHDMSGMSGKDASGMGGHDMSSMGGGDAGASKGPSMPGMPGHEMAPAPADGGTPKPAPTAAPKPAPKPAPAAPKPAPPSAPAPKPAPPPGEHGGH